MEPPTTVKLLKVLPLCLFFIIFFHFSAHTLISGYFSWD